jgi:hypothetical protein
MKLEYKIVDNFLQKEAFLEIKNIVMGSEFQWFYNNSVSYKNKKDGFYFTHTFYSNYKTNSEKMYLLNPIIEKIQPKSIIRIKANLYPKTKKIFEHGKHKDCEFSHKGFLFYINTNDGFTRLKDGTKIESIENRGLFFDPYLEHNSTNCTNQDARININFNYF